jgi:uncharacterized protein YjbI with pentapeptide repeats
LGTVWRRLSTTQRVWTVRIAIVLVILVATSYVFDKSLWDWLKLLIVPAVIAAGGYWFNRQQQERDRQSAEQRAQDDAIQAYLDQMSQLMIAHKLRQSKSDDDVRSVATARTRLVLRRLDVERKRSVVQFLYEAELVHKGPELSELLGAAEKTIEGEDYDIETLFKGKEAVLPLSRTDLQHIDLSNMQLPNIVLEKADLRHADLSNTLLWGANLTEAKLMQANLAKATVFRADLRGADLRGADLRGANLDKTSLSIANLSGADLREANVSQADLVNANVSGADLRGAYLSNNNLSEADISGADLSGASLLENNLHKSNLRDAHLTEVDWINDDLREANLRDAKGFPDLSDMGHFDRELFLLTLGTTLLQGVIMPNGQKYEEWLKAKEGRGEGGENGGPS